MSDSVRTQRRQPIRLPHPWVSPGKNTVVGCHFLLQRMNAKRESEVVQSCPTLSDPKDCSLLGSSVHGIFQARVLEGCKYLFKLMFSFSLDKYSGVKLLDCTVVLFFNFLRNFHTAFHSGCTNLRFHPQSIRVTFSLYPCHHLLLFSFWYLLFWLVWGDI